MLPNDSIVTWLVPFLPFRADALRRLLLWHGVNQLPIPVSLDLYRELKAVTPGSLGYLLHDLFAKNAYWELTVASALAQPAGAGQWRISFTIKARKVTVDSLGLETIAPPKRLGRSWSLRRR